MEVSIISFQTWLGSSLELLHCVLNSRRKVCLMAVLLFVDGNIINPKLLSSSIEIHPLLVFAAMIAGSAVGGLLGMLVAVPLMALAKLEFDKYIDRKEKEKVKG